MTPPDPVPDNRSAVKILAPWTLFGVVLLAAVVAFFLYADRVPSLLQALADH